LGARIIIPAVTQKASQPLLLDFENVTVLRGGRPALKSLTLKIPVGEHTVIFGPNGSGKSTLIKTITRECYPVQSPGTAFRIFGQDSWNVFDLRRLLGIVTNDLEAQLDREMTSCETVLTGFFSHLRHWPDEAVTPAMKRKVREVLAILDADHLAERPLGEMSSGEVRRVLIGRALVHNPKALILDEPTNSLDLRAAFEFRRSLRRIAALGKTIIIVTHQVEDVIPEVRRVVLLRQGRLFQDGPPARVLTSRHLNALFGIRIRLPALRRSALEGRHFCKISYPNIS
jgi:iron complex transport system ATP-binding protein